ncbi:pre-rRNA-processing protein TSR2 homolog [Neltuma alba]|uniref:pre-rRNA-processing protein TSR2 homolog n=1 Tax=Neltuma alba TaxID=207710 RepID=UPI0010A3EA43|nr:pre-rRNA-processing protein TSR2 homolog [Prosopis alba]
MERRLPADSIPIFNEGIALALYLWRPLRIAVESQLGGRESRQKADRLGSDILYWFTQCKEPLFIDDLEEMLYHGMRSLNMVIQDGSEEEVAEKLMVLHEECLEGNFRSIEILREASLKQAARPDPKELVNNDEDDDEDDDSDEDSDMAVEMEVPAMESMPKAAAEAEGDGWTVVSRRRNKGRN